MMGNFVIEGCDLSASACHLAGCRSQLLLQKSLFHDRIKYYLNTYLFYDLTFLGGGIPIGRVTEIFGQAGVDKTQLCLQLCANARLPKHFGLIGIEICKHEWVQDIHLIHHILLLHQ